jgi:hypothetical protein
MTTPNEEGRRFEQLTLTITREEAAQLAFASRQMRNKYSRLEETNLDRGWVPETGKRDANNYKKNLFHHLQRSIEKRLDETR